MVILQCCMFVCKWLLNNYSSFLGGFKNNIFKEKNEAIAAEQINYDWVNIKKNKLEDQYECAF